MKTKYMFSDQKRGSTLRKSIPLREYEVMGKAPRMDGMRVATVRKESKMFNRPMAHCYYRPKFNKPE